MARTERTPAGRSRGEHGGALRADASRAGRRRAGHARPQVPATGEMPLDSVQLFFKEAGRYPLLTAAEEVDLAQRIERGDMDAKERLINSNLRLVISNARRYQNLGLPLGDLIQEGVLGLIRASEKFDWRKGFKFSTYATLWIRQAIQRGLANTSRQIRVPVHVEQRQRKLARTENELTNQLGRDPSEEELAKAAEMEIDEIRALRDVDHSLTSLDLPIGEDGETTLGELFASDAPEPGEVITENERLGAVGEALDQLPESEREVIELRFGLADGKEKTLAAVGRELGISSERVHQLENDGLRRLRQDDRLEVTREAA